MIASTRLTGPNQIRTLVSGPAQSISLASPAQIIRVTQVTVGLTGASGAAGQISSDPNNAVSIGTDGGLFVSRDPQLATQDW